MEALPGPGPVGNYILTIKTLTVPYQTSIDNSTIHIVLCEYLCCSIRWDRMQFIYCFGRFSFLRGGFH